MPLSFYTWEDVALFGGREAEVKACARLLGRERTKVLLLQGATGCGKLSFLRAGLIPYLESEVVRFQFLEEYDVKNPKALFVRCTEAPLTRLCEALYDWGETPLVIRLPDADPEEVSMAEIRGGKDRATFIRENASSVPKLIEVLRAIESRLPKTAVLVIDQGEEILTLNDRDHELNKRLLFDFLIAFSETTIDLKIIVALRTEYFGAFYQELKKRRFSSEHVDDFLLPELSTQQLVEAIRYPTSRDIPPKYLQGRPQPGDHYNFDFEAGLPDKIVSGLRSVNKAEGGILPLLQVTCERLFRMAKARKPPGRRQSRDGPWKITSSDFAQLGELDQQIDRYVDDTIQEEIQRQLPKLDVIDGAEELALWKDLLFSMVVNKPDNTAVTDIRSEAELQNDPAIVECHADFRQMCDALTRERILRLDTRGSAFDRSLRTSVRDSTGEEEDVKYFSLGTDAIAVVLSKWSATRKFIKDRQDFPKLFVSLGIKIAGGYIIFLGLILIAHSLYTDPFEWMLFPIFGGFAFVGIAVYMLVTEFLAAFSSCCACFRGCSAQDRQPNEHCIRGYWTRERLGHFAKNARSRDLLFLASLPRPRVASTLATMPFASRPAPAVLRERSRG